MQLEVGTIVEGKVTGITKFGAFVALPDGKSGLVHISEIANTYVNDVHDHVTDGQTVKVKVIGIAPDGKINLSIKKAEAPEAPAAPVRRESNFTPRSSFTPKAPAPQQEMSFEDRLKQFMADSDSKIAGNRLYADKRTNTRRRSNGK